MDDVWATMTPEQQRDIAKQLAEGTAEIEKENDEAMKRAEKALADEEAAYR